jgi:steroid delta-isomerase-like uncharacterized protein
METPNSTNNKKIAKSFFDYFSKGEIKQIETLWTNDFKLHWPGKTSPLNKDESRALTQSYITGFPDLKFNVEDQISEGDLTVTRFTLTGTHKGNFHGIPPTNSKMKTTGVCTHRIVNGKIAEEWVEVDALGMLKQIGAVSEPLPR